MKLCGTCKHFTDKQGPGKVGTCRCFPPQLFFHLPSGKGPNAGYPEVTPDMRSCGQHKKDKRLITAENAAPTGQVRGTYDDT
jgi:hypothetical protein